MKIFNNVKLLKNSDIDLRLSPLERNVTLLKDQIKNLEERVVFNETLDIMDANRSFVVRDIEIEIEEIKKTLCSYQRRVLLLMSIFCALTALTAGLCFYSMFF